MKFSSLVIGFLGNRLPAPAVNWLNLFVLRGRLAALICLHPLKFYRRSTVFVVSDLGGFGHLPTEVDFAFQIADSRPMIVVMKSEKFPREFSQLLGSDIEFVNCKPLVPLSIGRRFTNQEELVLDILGKFLPSANVTSLARETKKIPDYENTPSGEHKWIGEYYRQFDPNVPATWINDTQPPRWIEDVFNRETADSDLNFGLYIRSKEVGGGRLHSSGRNGPEEEKMLLFFEKVSESCAIFVYGECSQGKSGDLRNKHRLIRNPRPERKSEWDLWIPILVSCVVGHPGGGMTLSTVARKPGCVVGAFGYWYGLPNTLHHFRLPEAPPAKLRRLFSDDPTEWAKLEPWMLGEVSGEDISELGPEFIRFLSAEVDNNDLFFEAFHRNCWIKYAKGAKLSARNLRSLGLAES